MKKKTFTAALRSFGYTHYRIKKTENRLILGLKKPSIVRGIQIPADTPARRVLKEFWQRVIVVEWQGDFPSFCEFYGFNDEYATSLYQAVRRAKGTGVSGEAKASWLFAL